MYTIVGALEKFGPEQFAKVKHEGVKFVVADREKKPAGGYPSSGGTWPEGSRTDKDEERPAAGFYNCVHKTIAMDQSSLNESLVLHEAAHALDDALTPDEQKESLVPWKDSYTEYHYDSDNHEKLQQLYDGYKGSGDESEWSDYGKKNVREYLAEGIEHYLGGDHTRGQLKEKDPEFYIFIKNYLGDK